MTKENQIRALAELDGWTFDPSVGYWRDENGYAHGSSDPLPYTTSYDAIIPLINKQLVGIQISTMENLHIIYWNATPPQLAEALLKAHGLWKD